MSHSIPLGCTSWLKELDKWTRSSPDFFVGRPVILDIAGFALERTEIAELIIALGECGIRVMGIEGADADQLGHSLPPQVRGGRPASGAEGTSDHPNGAPTVEPSQRPEPNCLLIESTIRSGQSVIFPYGDVTVLGSVASGAEVVAGGSVHIYGALPGRAMAGSMGNARARIFCKERSRADFDRRLLPGLPTRWTRRCAADRCSAGSKTASSQETASSR